MLWCLCGGSGTGRSGVSGFRLGGVYELSDLREAVRLGIVAPRQKGVEDPFLLLQVLSREVLGRNSKGLTGAWLGSRLGIRGWLGELPLSCYDVLNERSSY